MRNRVGLTLAFALTLTFQPVSAVDSGGRARNVILMVADGAGFNTWTATSMYQGTLGEEFYDSGDWVRLAASAHPLRRAMEPPVSKDRGTVQVPSFVFDPRRAWDPTPVEGSHGKYAYHFAGYKWLHDTRPDSANTATSMLSGVKTYNGSVNVDGAGNPMEATIASLARSLGMRVGTVTDVLFPHATPVAGSGAHHEDRRAYCPLAIEMLTRGRLDLIVGCGHPDFDNNGEPLGGDAKKEYRYVGGTATWNLLAGKGDLAAGDRVCTEIEEQAVTLDADQVAELKRWTLVDDTKQIEKLVRGETPDRLLVVPTIGEAFLPSGRPDDDGEPGQVAVGGTLQQQRGSRADPHFTPPGYDAPIETVPSLATLTRVALNAVDDDPEGFFLLIEGGAIDWAMHENQLGRMIEETIGFKEAVREVTDWVDARDGWDETLVVVVADHDHMLWGPSSDTVPFDPLVDNGAGELPSYRWLSDTHSNLLVPLFARGVGAERFNKLTDGEDPFYGRYVDHTDIHTVFEAVLTGR